MPKIKKIKAGKIKRHKMRKAIGVKQGFGKPWSAPSVTFRVEFSWVTDRTADSLGSPQASVAVNFDESEENEQVHWVECRKFQGEERRFLKTHYDQSDDWTEGETIESRFVCVYCASFLVEQMKALSARLEALGVKEKPQTMTAESIKLLVPSAYILEPARIVNQAFVFPTPKKGNETIRSPIYQIRWTEELARNTIFNESIAIVMKNSIYHNY